MLVSIETADDHSGFSDQFPDVDSIKSYVNDLTHKISQLELSEEEEEKEILTAFQSTLFSGQESKPAAENDFCENMFQDGEFEKGYEEKSWRRWTRSESVEDRTRLALEGHRTLLGLEPEAELRDEVVKDLSLSAAKDDLDAGWSDYIIKLSS